MVSFKPVDEPLFTTVSLYSLLGVVALLAVAHFSGKAMLPAKTRKTDQAVFVWLIFDGLIHLIFEGAFLYTSMGGRTAFKENGFAASLSKAKQQFERLPKLTNLPILLTSTLCMYEGKEYAKADVRWGNSDPTVVSLELLTVFIGGPLSLYCAYLLTKNSMARHPWLLILSTGELYGGWMTFCPEWLTGSRNLRTDNFLHMWIYLFLMNTLWVFIPFGIMVDSYSAIMKAFKVANAHMKVAKGKTL